MHSLRARLLYRTTAVLVGALVVAAAALYLLMRASLLAELDAALLLEARALAAHVERVDDRLQIEPEIAALPEYSTARHSHYYQIWDAGHRSALRSPSLAGYDLHLPAAPPLQPLHRPAMLPDHKSGREVAFCFEPQVDEDDEPTDEAAPSAQATLVVARETAQLDATLAQLAGLLVVVTTAAAGVCIPLTGRVVRRQLQPLGALARSIERVGAADLTNRIGVPDCPSELAPVVNCLNQLLARLNEALLREQSFTADVAHELRTPLAGLETTLEVCATRQRDPEAYHTVIASCLEITRGMHAMVDNLLHLARADANQFSLTPEPRQLAGLVREGWLPFDEAARRRELRVDWKPDEAARVLVDHRSFRQILANLFDNALTYTEPNGRVVVSIVDQGSRAVLTIANDGCRLSRNDVSRVFDRFWRADASRTATGLHCGLGLSLCKKLVELQRGTIAADVRDGSFFVTLTLPSAE